MPESFLCCEIIREKLLHNLRDEVPHGIGVELEKFMERKDGVVEIHALIYCERQSHKGIVMGHRGAMLKRIGSQARGELEDFFGTKVFLHSSLSRYGRIGEILPPRSRNWATNKPISRFLPILQPF